MSQLVTEKNGDLLNKIFPQKYMFSPKLNGILFDTETRTINDELVLRLGYYVRVLNDVIVEKNFFYDKNDFTRKVISYCGSNGHFTSYVWAHNTGFDFRVGINTILFNPEFSLTIVSSNPFIINYQNTVIDIEGEDKHYNILFLDTFNFFKTSIEKLGDFFGIKKIDIDFVEYEKRGEEIPEDLLKERCVNDVMVLYSVLKTLYRQMPNRVKWSSAQLSYSTFKSCLPYVIDKINTDLASKSYHGGRVEVFRRDEAEVIKYDVNSMYPYVMLKYGYPTEIFNGGIMIEPEFDVVKDLVDEGYGYIADVSLNVPINKYIPLTPMLREKDKRLIFPVGQFRTVACSPEIDFSEVTKFHKVEFYRLGKIFEQFVNKYYPLKQSSTGFMREFYKVGILNSCYGKFGQKYVKTERYNKYDDKMEFGHLTLEDIEGKFSLLKFLGGDCYKNIGYGRKNSVAVASFVCSYARKELYNYLRKYENEIIYCDTDCFVLPKKIKLKCDDELGGIKIEGEGKAQFFTPKIYFFDKDGKQERKIKGVKKDWKYVIKGDEILAHGNRFTNFSESINFHDFKVKRVHEKKVIRLIDNKRVWKGNCSTPIILS